VLVDRTVPADSGTGVQFITLFTDEDDAEKLNETLAGALARVVPAGPERWQRNVLLAWSHTTADTAACIRPQTPRR
jgi:hypothetical protein